MRTIRRLLATINQRFNEPLAVRVTLAFGTMWTTYLFFLYGLVPVLLPQLMNTLLYWSNTVQLWALPLLMVGTNVLGRQSERQAQLQYQMVQEIRQLEEAQRAMLDTLIHLTEREIQALKEIDAEIEALDPTKGEPPCSSSTSCPPSVES